MNAPNRDASEPAPVFPGPGEQLRSARERASLSVHEIAANLRLDSKTVHALESDDYDQLPAPTFVRGYLHGYARLLEEPVEPIIAAFEQQDIAPPLLVADIAEKPQAQSTDFPVRVATYGVVAVLILLVVAWSQSQRTEPATAIGSGPNPSATPAATTAELDVEPDDAVSILNDEASTGLIIEHIPDSVALSGSDPASGQSPLDPEPETSTEDGSSDDPESGATAGSDGMLAQPEESLTQDVIVATADSVAVEGENIDALAVGDQPAGDSELDASAMLDDPAASAGTDATASGASSGDRLAIRVSGESWVEAYDHSGKRLFYNLISEGNRMVVEGRGPMRVVLGNAGQATVEFNGTLIDYAPFVARGIARFIVGGADAQLSPDPDALGASQ